MIPCGGCESTSTYTLPMASVSCWRTKPSILYAAAESIRSSSKVP